MPDSTETSAAAKGPSRLECSICHELGADVCIRITPSASGAGHSVYAHRVCANDRGITVLYALVWEQTGAAS